MNGHLRIPHWVVFGLTQVPSAHFNGLSSGHPFFCTQACPVSFLILLPSGHNISFSGSNGNAVSLVHVWFNLLEMHFPHKHLSGLLYGHPVSWLSQYFGSLTHTPSGHLYGVAGSHSLIEQSFSDILHSPLGHSV